ncbi:hypothetical protein THASP1DRAFT_29358 [Thamnocephalis sphaerospora]|uniref:Uncharacterized protein n=1 Tax=Thamnocephalis sphaerospora TaxID=78915 RepID=A0A4P9XRW6_9FUNG|nr:hypothetical protein THASP1DRAFT_29358 [Thamnocephalis sphaerospora]|eukprot:RKP08853.1 hypothetical protein THASP1DRAFT_29358 [Thamnocephalis sphaerospora]
MRTVLRNVACLLLLLLLLLGWTAAVAHGALTVYTGDAIVRLSAVGYFLAQPPAFFGRDQAESVKAELVRARFAPQSDGNCQLRTPDPAPLESANSTGSDNPAALLIAGISWAEAQNAGCSTYVQAVAAVSRGSQYAAALSAAGLQKPTAAAIFVPYLRGSIGIDEGVAVDGNEDVEQRQASWSEPYTASSLEMPDGLPALDTLMVPLRINTLDWLNTLPERAPAVSVTATYDLSTWGRIFSSSLFTAFRWSVDGLTMLVTLTGLYLFARRVYYAQAALDFRAAVLGLGLIATGLLIAANRLGYLTLISLILAQSSSLAAALGYGLLLYVWLATFVSVQPKQGVRILRILLLLGTVLSPAVFLLRIYTYHVTMPRILDLVALSVAMLNALLFSLVSQILLLYSVVCLRRTDKFISLRAERALKWLGHMSAIGILGYLLMAVHHVMAALPFGTTAYGNLAVKLITDISMLLRCSALLLVYLLETGQPWRRPGILNAASTGIYGPSYFLSLTSGAELPPLTRTPPLPESAEYISRRPTRKGSAHSCTALLDDGKGVFPHYNERTAHTHEKHFADGIFSFSAEERPFYRTGGGYCGSTQDEESTFTLCLIVNATCYRHNLHRATYSQASHARIMLSEPSPLQRNDCMPADIDCTLYITPTQYQNPVESTLNYGNTSDCPSSCLDPSNVMTAQNSFIRQAVDADSTYPLYPRATATVETVWFAHANISSASSGCDSNVPMSDTSGLRPADLTSIAAETSKESASFGYKFSRLKPLASRPRIRDITSEIFSEYAGEQSHLEGGGAETSWGPYGISLSAYSLRSIPLESEDTFATIGRHDNVHAESRYVTPRRDSTGLNAELCSPAQFSEPCGVSTTTSVTSRSFRKPKDRHYHIVSPFGN